MKLFTLRKPALFCFHEGLELKALCTFEGLRSFESGFYPTSEPWGLSEAQGSLSVQVDCDRDQGIPGNLRKKTVLSHFLKTCFAHWKKM